MSGSARQEEKKWDLVFRLLADLRPDAHASAEAEKAAPGKRRYGTAESSILSAQRHLQLSSYQMSSRATEISIYKPLSIDRRDWTRWKHGELKESSVISVRIRESLSRPKTAEDSPRAPR